MSFLVPIFVVAYLLEIIFGGIWAVTMALEADQDEHFDTFCRCFAFFAFIPILLPIKLIRYGIATIWESLI